MMGTQLSFECTHTHTHTHTHRHNASECLAFNETVDNITYYTDVCEYAHTGAGLVYQVVAGPVFNNLYPFAGIFTGFLADYGRRTIWLVIAVTFWSLATGLTGFAQHYWHLVLLRALLAIGYVIISNSLSVNPFTFLSLPSIVLLDVLHLQYQFLAIISLPSFEALQWDSTTSVSILDTVWHLPLGTASVK